MYAVDVSCKKKKNLGPSGPIWSFTGPEGQIAVTVEPRLTTNDGHMLLESELAGVGIAIVFFFSSRRRHTRLQGDWSSDVCSSDLYGLPEQGDAEEGSLGAGI